MNTKQRKNNNAANTVQQNDPNVAPGGLLDVFIGKWNTEGKTIPSPSTPAVTIKGTDTYEWLGGRFFMIHHVDVIMGDEEMKAIEIISYEASSNNYPSRSYDSQGNTGTYELSFTDGLWSILGETERATILIQEDQKSMQVKWERSTNGSDWLHWMDITLTKSI